MKTYQEKGIGKELVEITKSIIGDQTSLILLSALSALAYYPKLGMQKIENGFIIKRTT